MKIKNLFHTMLVVLLCYALVSCGTADVPEDIWESAVYTENTEFGDGEKTITVEVEAEERSVTFKINTDQETLGDALLSHSLISGEKGPYGLYVKSVNGIVADYNTTKSYWALNKAGEYMQTGVDTTEITDGESYSLVYTKIE